MTLLFAVAVAALFACVKAAGWLGRRGIRPETGRAGVVLASVAGCVAFGLAVLGVLVLGDHWYDTRAWSVLDRAYGVRPADPGASFREAVPFAATAAGSPGRIVQCTVHLPSTVVCDGALVPVREGS